MPTRDPQTDYKCFSTAAISSTSADLFVKIMISEIKSFDVPRSCIVFFDVFNVSRMLPGSPGDDVTKSHVGCFFI